MIFLVPVEKVCFGIYSHLFFKVSTQFLRSMQRKDIHIRIMVGQVVAFPYLVTYLINLYSKFCRLTACTVSTSPFMMSTFSTLCTEFVKLCSWRYWAFSCDLIESYLVNIVVKCLTNNILNYTKMKKWARKIYFTKALIKYIVFSMW